MVAEVVALPLRPHRHPTGAPVAHPRGAVVEALEEPLAAVEWVEAAAVVPRVVAGGKEDCHGETRGRRFGWRFRPPGAGDPGAAEGCPTRTTPPRLFLLA